MRKCGVQSTKVICCNRFIYDVNIFNDRINILELPEFVVIRKEFGFMTYIFYLWVNKFKYIGNCFGQRLSWTVFTSCYEPGTYWIYVIWWSSTLLANFYLYFHWIVWDVYCIVSYLPNSYLFFQTFHFQRLKFQFLKK